MGTEPTIYGVRIYLDTAEADNAVGPELDTGLFTPVMTTGQTSVGSRVITFAPYWGTYQFKVGRKVLISKGFPSTTHYYLIKSKTFNTITIDDSEDAASSNQTGVVVKQQSEFRWAEIGIQADEHNDWQNWIGGMLAENPIDGIEEGGDTTQGGCPVQYEGLSITVCNTEKLLLLLNNIGVNLNNLPVEIYRHIPNYGFGPPIEKTVIFTGICEEVSWNETDLVIKCKNTRYKRNALHSTVLDNGVIVPITFGRFVPSDPNNIASIAKLVRTRKNMVQFEIGENETWFGVAGVSGYRYVYTNPEGSHNAMPVIHDGVFNGGVHPAIHTYQVRFQLQGGKWYDYNGVEITTGTITLNSLIGKNIKSIDGDASVGSYRKIENARVNLDGIQGGKSILLLTVAEYFEKPLHGNLAGTQSGNSWIVIETHERSFRPDVWPCKNFLDSSGAPIASDDSVELYAYTEEKSGTLQEDGESVLIKEKTPKYVRLPNFAYSENANPEHNQIDIAVTYFENDPDEMKSFIVSKVIDPALIDSTDLSGWFGGSWVKLQNGWFANATGKAVNIQASSGINYINDKNRSSSAYFSAICPSHDGTYGVAVAIKFKMPTVPFDYDSMFIGVRCKWESQNVTGTSARLLMVISGKRFMGSGSEIQRIESTFTGDKTAWFDCLLDQFYTVNPNTKNQYFFITVNNGVDQFYGYKTFVANATKENVDISKEACIILYNERHDICGFWINLYELAIIYLKNVSVKEEVFTQLDGRIFNDTWGGRKTSGNMINNPIEIAEMIRRLGNWGETGEKKNWGKEYATTAKIKTSGEGSFDDSILNDIKSFSLAFQIFEEDKMNSDSIISALCRNFDFCSYIDADGNECVSPLSKTNPTETIELKDIVGDIGEIIEPDSNDVFCEPTVKYEYDSGSDSFRKTLAVNNIEADTWLEEYTPGFNATDGQIVWNKCKSLYVRFKQITQPDNEFIEQYMIPTYEGAVKYLIAKLDKMARRRIPFSVHYAKGKNYHFAKHVMLKLAYHTNNYSLECFIERVKKNKNNNLVELTVVLIDDITIMDYIIQDIAAGGTPERGIYQEVVDDPIEKYQDSANQRG